MATSQCITFTLRARASTNRAVSQHSCAAGPELPVCRYETACDFYGVLTPDGLTLAPVHCPTRSPFEASADHSKQTMLPLRKSMFSLQMSARSIYMAVQFYGLITCACLSARQRWAGHAPRGIRNPRWHAGN